MKRVRTEVYSRVVGFFRPVSSWNKGKKEEFKERKVFNLESTSKNMSKSTSKKQL